MFSNDNYPFNCLLPRTLQVGDQIILRGKLQYHPETLSMNLVKDSKNVALHYKIEYPRGRTKLNTMVNGVWGAELIYPQVTAEPGADFTVKFAMETDKIVIYINDKRDLEFKYRSIPMNEIKELQFWNGLSEIISTEHIYGKN